MLAGGRSTRMGRDKALIEVGGRALASIAGTALQDAGANEVFAVGGTGLERLGFRVVPDRWPGEGPLGGIVTALEAATCEIVVVLACDLPLVTGEAVASVVNALADAVAGHDAAVPVVGGRAQHLLAAWRRDAVLESLRTAMAAGERAIWRATASLHVAPVTFRDDDWARDVDNADALFRGQFEG